MSTTLPRRFIESRIYEIRGKKIMLDRDLAELYRVKTKVLNQAVTRNEHRFPDDFMFRLNKEEFRKMRSHSVTSSWGGTRYPPRAFTEHGILMLSNVLKSEHAIKASIQIIRVFVEMRQMVQEHKNLLEIIQRIERRQDVEAKEIWKAIRLLQRQVIK